MSRGMIWSFEIGRLSQCPQIITGVEPYFKNSLVSMNSVFQQIAALKQWDEQVALLEEVVISQSTAKLLNNLKNSAVIKSLLANSRSKVITSTFDFLVGIFQKYGPLLHSFALSIFTSDCLFRLLNSSNKVISASCNEVFKAIIVNSPHSKFYQALIAQFSSKNPHVREYLSTYFLVLVDMMEPPSNFSAQLRNWKDDPNVEVRKNINHLWEILLIRQDQKKKINKSRVGDKQNSHRGSKAKEKVQSSQSKYCKVIVEASQSQMIMDSFQADSNELEYETNIDFLISKINSDEPWNIKILAINELFEYVQAFQLPHSHFEASVQTIISLLDEKRSRVSKTASIAMWAIFQHNSPELDKVLSTNYQIFLEKSVKSEPIAKKLIPRLIRLDPVKYILHLCQCAVDVKSIKEKVISLDLLVDAVCQHALPSLKVAPMVKMICLLLQRHHQQKQIYFPCMVVLSHFKSTNSQPLLRSLLCQGGQLLSRIISIAEEIDPSLRDGIISYIQGLKGEAPQKQEKVYLEPSIREEDQKEIHELEKLIELVREEKEYCVEQLAQKLFELIDMLEAAHFSTIIKLAEEVISESVLLDVELLLDELCKANCQPYLSALFQALHSCSSNPMESEYALSYLRKITILFIHSPHFLTVSHAQKLVNLYRSSTNAKVRMHCIRLLGALPPSLSAELTSEKEKELMGAQAQVMQNRDMSSFSIGSHMDDEQF